MTAGLYSVLDMILAGIYVLLSPLSDHSGSFLHQVYSVGYYTGAAVIRIMGGYLLLGKFTRSRAARIIALVLANVFLSSFLINRGMQVNNLYSYLPLLLYFVLNFFENFNLKDACLAALVMALAVSNSPFFGLSYFYLIVHFFMISCAAVYAYFALKDGSKRRVLRREPAQWGYAAAVAAVIVILILPYALMQSDFKNDFFIANSGVNGTVGRLQAAGVDAYFSFPGRSYVNPGDFLTKSVDFTLTRWGSTWMFLGVGMLFLILSGLVLSRQRLKGVIVCLTVFVLSMNIPASKDSVPGFAHWINVLTNPFHFLIRSVHMSTLLWYLTLTPLIALGAEALIALAAGRREAIHAGRLYTFLGFFAGSCVLTACLSPGRVQGYVLLQGSLIVAIMLLLSAQKQKMKWAAALLGVILIAVELAALKNYVDEDLDVQVHLKPQVYSGVRSAEPILLDHQNPKVFPNRAYYKNSAQPVFPPAYTYQNTYGAYYSHYPLMERFLRSPSLYEPRPLVFKDLHRDGANATYLQKDGRMMFFAPYAMDDSRVRMEDLLSLGLERQVVLLPAGSPGMVPPDQAIVPQPMPAVRPQEFALDLKKAKRIQKGTNIEWHLTLPGSFPSYVTSTVFTQDQDDLQLWMGDRSLTQVQGGLVAPYSFDVQNIKEGKAVVLLPQGIDPSSAGLKLVYKRSDGIKEIWKNTHDAWGLTIEAPVDGWVVFHYPYDPKWKIIVDGRTEALYKADHYYLAVRVTKGEHRFLLK